MWSKRHSLKLARLKKRLHYNPQTGKWAWLDGKRKGLQAGTLHNSGHIRIHLDGYLFLAGPLAWFYMMGKWPKKTIDHRDRNKQNNKWVNLREATFSQQLANRLSSRKDKLPRGVQRIICRGRYQYFVARLGNEGKRGYLGCFNTPEEAFEVYQQAAFKKWGKDWVELTRYVG